MNAFHGSHLRLARESQGWPQTRLAEVSGVAQGSISKYEKGLQRPGDGQITALADALGFTESFFAENEMRPAGVMYRSRSLRSARLEAQVRARINLVRLIVTRWLNEVEIDVDTPTRFFDADTTFDSPPAAASQLRSAWWIPPGPIDRLCDYVEAAGGVVVRLDMATDDVTAAYLHPLGDTRRWFFVNTRVAAGDRVRFSLAHELGHAVLHEGPLLPDSRQAERESDTFAGELLVPAAELLRELPRGRLRLPHLIELKRHWNVSIASLAMCAHRSGAISKAELTSLYMELGALGYRRSEPVEVEVERPQLLPAVLEVHRSEHGYSDADLARLGGVAPRVLSALLPEHFKPARAPHLHVVSRHQRSAARLT